MSDNLTQPGHVVLAVGCAALLTAIVWQGWRIHGTLTGRAIVTDGDTIHIGSHRVRLAAIDAPESAQMCGTIACGDKARAYLVDLIAGQPVSCRKLDTDRYRRMVAICHNRNGVELGEAMVRAGWAIELRYYSNGRYSAAEREARTAGAGVWSLPFRRPSEFRAEEKR
jgi:endonuclease YncB( thermonuclease family)